MKLVTGGQMREMEQIAVNELGIPSILLMENAAAHLADHCLRYLQSIENPKNNQNSSVLIAAGPGNNGGDGLALARLLHTKGVNVKAILTGDMSYAKGDAAEYLSIVKKLGIQIEQFNKKNILLLDDIPDIKTVIETADLTVDALLGTGLDRGVEGKIKELIEAINCYAKYVISADMPSGVHSDTGRVMGCAVRADETVTFGFPKIGLYAFPGAEYAGRIHIEDIMIPARLIDIIDAKAEILTVDEAQKMLPARGNCQHPGSRVMRHPIKLRTNKGTFGKIAVFAGSDEMPGAAALTCGAAYKTGGGLVCACVLPHVADVIHHWQRETVTRILPEKNGMYSKKCVEMAKEEIHSSDVIIIGPGIGRSPDVTEFVHELIVISQEIPKPPPLVIDADALFALSEDVNIFKQLKAPCIITPHPGEMSRLTGWPIPEILDDIINTAVSFAGTFNVVTLLKDAHTVIASPDGRYFLNTTGNNALSKAGTGDVLTGMIAGYIAQGKDVFSAGVLGAHFHGKAGEAASEKKTLYGVMAGDLLEGVWLSL